MNENISFDITATGGLFALVWEKSIDGMRLLDENGTMILVNDSFCRMTGKSRDELIGKSFSVIYAENNQEKMLEKEKLRFNSKAIAPHLERELTLWNGRTIWFELSNNYLEAENGSLMLLSIFRDITTRKETEARLLEEHNLMKRYSEELRETNAGKDKLFSIISHDLKSPFQGLLGISDMLIASRDFLRTDETEVLLKQLNAALHNQYKLLENLLQWSRLESGRMGYEPVEIDIRQRVEDTINLLCRNASKKNIELINLVPEGMKACADRAMLGSIMQNLVSNAIKFTPEGGSVTINCRKDRDGKTAVSIRDTGVGFDTRYLDDLMKPGYNRSTPGTNNEPGTGLGLMICKEMIEKNQGRLTAESKPGCGTEFTFTLPCCC